jgi:membrane protein YqaA with SNARE-associated domain
MSGRFPSTSFVGTMLIIDVVLLGIISSSLLPVEPSPIVIGFGLFGLSPALAYLLTSERVRS